MIHPPKIRSFNIPGFNNTDGSFPLLCGGQGAENNLKIWYAKWQREAYRLPILCDFSLDA